MIALTGELNNRDRWLVPLSLAASFIANDGEELLTYVSSVQESLDRLPPEAAAPEWARNIDQRHINVGIAIMGGLTAAAVADGIRTRGKGWLYQDWQWAFGLHGFGHILMSLVARRYVSGVISSPLVVIPQLAYAVHTLRKSGVPQNAHPVRAVAVGAGWLAMAHTLGAAASATQNLFTRRGHRASGTVSIGESLCVCQ